MTASPAVARERAMQGGARETPSNPVERIELVLRELDALPTLDAVAVRLLELTSDDDAEASEVIQLVSSDPALASKVLSLCRCHEVGRASRVTTIERAVLLLGFDAVRWAVLSVQMFDIVDHMTSPGGECSGERPVFDRRAFWLHALGVAVASEKIAARGTLSAKTNGGEAFIAGLLHDIGELVLHVLLPESFDRVCRMAETHSATLDHACRQIIGIDTHTVGKRVAEHWGLPQPLVDVIWLNGQPFEALPAVCGEADRTLIALVSLADAIVRQRYITTGAQSSPGENLSALCIPVGITLEELEGIASSLHEEVSARAAALGLAETCDAGVLLQSISRANESLARANEGLRQRDQLAKRQAHVLAAISAFHAALPAGSPLMDVLGRIAPSASEVFDTAVLAALHESPDGDGMRLVQFDASGRPFGSRTVTPPIEAVPFPILVADAPLGAPADALLPWLGETLEEEVELAALRLIALAAGEGDGAILLLRAPLSEKVGAEPLEPLMQCWRAALAAGIAHDRSGHLAEQLAEANRAVLDMQETLSRSRTMATLGEVAAGAAHEMNNPLTVISGRSQLLANRVEDPELRTMALDMAGQSHRLSDMITALRSFAEPVTPDIRPVDLPEVILRAVQQTEPQHRRQPQVNTVFTSSLPPVHVDGELIGAAVSELVRNAMEAKGTNHIELRVQTDPLDDRLRIEVRDDGSGLNEHALRHAFDPFFSEKPAGRQPGLGLARARRYVEAHGGRITLVNNPSGGALATIWLGRWNSDDQRQGEAA